MSATRTAGQRAGLSREQVLSAGRELVDELGLPGLSMRTLANRLGVRPNALYSHVANKEDLVDAVLDEVLAEVRIPPDDPDRPLEGIRALMTSSYEVLLEHADLVPVYLARQGSSGPRAQRLGEVTLGLLERAGVSGGRAREGLRVLIVYTIGFAAINPGASGTPGGVGAGPRLTESELRHNFERGLRWLLTGIAGAE